MWAIGHARMPGYHFFFFNDTATTEIYTLSLHDALPISAFASLAVALVTASVIRGGPSPHQASVRTLRSEEHTSELQSRRDLVCRLLLEKKKKTLKLHHLRRKKKKTSM